MQRLQLAFFGSVWHPKWSYQYRDFPSVHFMLIDLQRVSRYSLDFRSDIGGDLWDNVVSPPRVLMPRDVRILLQVGRFRDTGWRVQRRFGQRVRSECLTPHFNLVGERARASGLHRFAQKVLASPWSVLPKSGAQVTQRSFLKSAHAQAYSSGWEEFFWPDCPFGVHLRLVGRHGAGEPDQRMLINLLKKRNK